MKYPIRALLLLCLIFCLISIPGQAQTSFIDIEHPLPASRWNSELIAGADGHVFILDHEGYLLRSVDDGMSWESIETPFQGYEVYGAAGSHEGVIVVSSAKTIPDSNSGNTWYSEDNGITWGALGDLFSGFYNYTPYIWVKPESITIKRVETAFGEQTRVYTMYNLDGVWTDDGGGMYMMTNGDEMLIVYSSGMSACLTICGFLYVFRKDADNDWIEIYDQVEDDHIEGFYISGIAILTDEHWVVTTTLGLHITEDAGETWSVIDEGRLASPSQIVKSPSGELFTNSISTALGNKLLESSDNGQTWSEVDLSENEGELPNYLSRFVVSSNGYVYRYHASSTNNYFLRSENFFTSTDPDESVEIPVSVALHQNYPNPFNPATTISFDLPEPTSATLEIYDLQGRLIERLLNDSFLHQGNHSVSWDAGNMATGLYIYRLRAGNEIHTKKMLLIK